MVELAEAGNEVVIFDDAYVSSTDRALGTHLAGKLMRVNSASQTNGNGAGKVGLNFKRALLNLAKAVPGNASALSTPTAWTSLCRAACRTERRRARRAAAS